MVSNFLFTISAIFPINGLKFKCWSARQEENFDSTLISNLLKEIYKGDH